MIKDSRSINFLRVIFLLIQKHVHYHVPYVFEVNCNTATVQLSAISLSTCHQWYQHWSYQILVFATHGQYITHFSILLDISLVPPTQHIMPHRPALWSYTNVPLTTFSSQHLTRILSIVKKIMLQIFPWVSCLIFQLCKYMRQIINSVTFCPCIYSKFAYLYY